MAEVVGVMHARRQHHRIALDLGLGVGPYMLGAFKESLGFQGIYFAVGLGAVGCAALYYLLYARRRDARAAAAEGEMTEEELEAELEEA